MYKQLGEIRSSRISSLGSMTRCVVSVKTNSAVNSVANTTSATNNSFLNRFNITTNITTASNDHIVRAPMEFMSLYGTQRRCILTELSNSDEYRERIRNAPKDQLMVVQYTASWCGPCRHIKPIVAKWSSELPTVSFLVVDIDELTALTDEESIQNVPTFVLIKDGCTIERIIGANAEKLKTAIDTHSNPKET